MVRNKSFRDGLWRRHRACYVRPDRVAPILAAAICVFVVSSCSASSALIVRVIPNGEVALVPRVSAGWAGWCMAVVDKGSSSCGSNRAVNPIFSESWSAEGGATRGAALTTSEVMTVSVDGSRPVPTRETSAVAGVVGLRSVIVEIQSKKIRVDDNSAYPHFTPLNASGSVIRRSTTIGPPLGVSVPVRRWQQPQHAPTGVCELRTNWPGVSARWGKVTIEVKESYPGLIGRPFLSCASTEYFREQQPVEAGILLDASHPGTEPPPLPAMKAVSGHPGIFQAQGESGEGQLLARRVPDAWLVVEEGGSTFDERLALLEHLRARVAV